jgi:hypothetical protein
MSKNPARRGVLAAAITTALLIGLLAASQAQASTLYACVKKNGTAHLYSKKPKCKKGEKKINWNNTGPAGKNGANGSNGGAGAGGAAGKDGAVAGYFAVNSSVVSILTGTIEKPITVASKKLPPGSYIANAKTTISTTDKENGAKWVAQCQLSDVPVSGTSTFDASNATGEVVQNFLFHTGAASVPLGMAFTTTTESTLTLACTHVWESETKGSFTMAATNSFLSAIQLSSLS